MRLPQNLLSPGTYTKPRLFLCETDKTKICQLEVSELNGSFKFNSMSELSFEVARIYNNIVTGETKVNPFYDKIEALRLIYLEGFGYFELQGPELVSDGIKEAKSCTAYSLEYTLSQKYLDHFYVNMGTVDSLEVLNAASEKEIVPIVLYNQAKPELSLLHLILEKIYGWKIGHVDQQLRTLSRQFEVDRESVYDFILNEICDKFNCYVVFNTIDNTINLYAESPTAKFIGNGRTNKFTIAQPFSKVETVSIDGYKTTRWAYSIVNGEGILVLEDIPEKDAMIEVIGVDSTWETDVYVTFDNLSQEINVSYDADAIKTVLTVTYGDDLDIREVNLGMPYLTDLSYYYTPDWMGQDLYDAYTKYMEKSNNSQSAYTNNSKEILKLNDYISYEENRLSLEYSLAIVSSVTVGTYYTRQQNADGSYYYTEVSLPSEYKVGVDYYSNVTTNLNEEKVDSLYAILKQYFYAYLHDQTDKITDVLNQMSELADNFKFMKTYTIAYLVDNLQAVESISEADTIISNFLSEMWTEIGRTPLKALYLAPYKTIQETNIKAGWSITSNDNYGYYYPVVILIKSIEAAIKERDAIIKSYQEQQSVFQQNNADISNNLSMDNNFTEGQLIRLSAFMREDELHLDDIVETSMDDLSSSFKIKQDAMESGRIELQKLCQPQLQFSMTMANIYALSEFEPIINQFQLGNIIRVALRSDYIKQARLLQVNINFENFSDFSCEFGELTSLRTQSDIHADLLSKAVNAGKSVASNSAKWTKGADQATALDLKIQQGLLDAVTQIKAMDGTQNAYIDKYGIHLERIDPETGEVDPRQGWIVNNQFLYSSDGFQTTESVFGEYTIGDATHWGLLAQAVIAGYIQGSTIEGGTINIGNGAFKVDSDGTVTMNASGNKIEGYATEDQINNPIISTTAPEGDIKDGQLWLDTSFSENVLRMWNGTTLQWEDTSYQNGGVVYTSRPDEYTVGDLWILAAGETCGIYREGSILKANTTSSVFDESYWDEAIPGDTEQRNGVQQFFQFTQSSGLKIGEKEDNGADGPFYVQIDSQEMGFYDNSDGDDVATKVVHIGNKSATIQNAIFTGEQTTFNNDAMFKNNAIFNQQLNICQPNATSGFIWKVEENGSFSLAIM